MKVKFYGMIHTLLNDNKFHAITFSATDKKFLCVKGMKMFFNLYNQQDYCKLVCIEFSMSIFNIHLPFVIDINTEPPKIVSNYSHNFLK